MTKYFIGDLIPLTPSEVSSPGKFPSQCWKHGKSFEFLCEDCSKILCSEELQTGSNSYDKHKLSKLSDFSGNIQSTIRKELGYLSEAIFTITEMTGHLESKIKQINIEKESIRLERNQLFRSFLSLMKNNYEKQETILETLGKDLKVLMSEVIDLANQAEKMLKQLVLEAFL